ncbi:helix-turn-helix domain-containing protein [Pseudoscardovia radai]|nr:helix-turn-helix transcriptional regulator [Pseudoscardovia radai]
MNSKDKELGLQLLRAREARQMSRDALADAMRRRGNDWTRSTVWSIERGERSIKLREAEDLHNILDMTFGSAVSGEKDENYEDYAKRKWELEVTLALDRLKNEYWNVHDLAATLKMEGFKASDVEGFKGLGLHLSVLGQAMDDLFLSAPQVARDMSTETFLKTLEKSGTCITPEDEETFSKVLARRQQLHNIEVRHMEEKRRKESEKKASGETDPGEGELSDGE